MWCLVQGVCREGLLNWRQLWNGVEGGGWRRGVSGEVKRGKGMGEGREKQNEI